MRPPPREPAPCSSVGRVLSRRPHPPDISRPPAHHSPSLHPTRPADLPTTKLSLPARAAAPSRPPWLGSPPAQRQPTMISSPLLSQSSRPPAALPAPPFAPLCSPRPPVRSNARAGHSPSRPRCAARSPAARAPTAQLSPTPPPTSRSRRSAHNAARHPACGSLPAASPAGTAARSAPRRLAGPARSQTSPRPASDRTCARNRRNPSRLPARQNRPAPGDRTR